MVALPLKRQQEGGLLASFFPFLEQGGEVYCLDAGNRFNPYPLALRCRALGRPPEPCLEKVFVSRAATCHQMVAVVEEMLLPLARNPGQKVVMVLGIETLFVDEDLPLFERRYLFRRALSGIHEIRSAGIGCVVTHHPEQEETLPWHRVVHQTLKPIPLEDPAHGQNHSHLHKLPGK
ncbi:MAG: hypothetical protein AMXMBFR75_16740 [Candidatus Hinthialibacteria bacterium]|nr:hypothetical protein [bacterium]MCE7907200.1 hypothetical protein [Candidatus Omnitrophica bacterium COP1]